MKTILVTGSAGFIGFHLCKSLLRNSTLEDEFNNIVVGVDNFNGYYDINLKHKRSDILEKFDRFNLEQGDINDQDFLNTVFRKHKIDYVIHLAAFAGVRHSFEKPLSYLNNNILGTTRIFEKCCQLNNIQHVVYASSSSVYGDNTEFPFSTDQKTDTPISMYAASKKATELIAYSYAYNYNMPVTGLRFFTVYGPWGRPDMALFLFTKAILENKPIKVFNHGNMERDFTYIDDIVDGVVRVLSRPSNAMIPFNVYNIGSGRTVTLNYYIELIEKNLGKKAIKELLGIPAGDITKTFSDISKMKSDFGYEPKTSVEEGVKNFIDWYKEYYDIKTKSKKELLKC